MSARRWKFETLDATQNAKYENSKCPRTCGFYLLICFTVKGSLQFIHCGALSLFQRCTWENFECPIRHLVKIT